MKALTWINGVGLVLSIASLTFAAEEVRYVENGGVTYRETRRTYQRPVSETRWEARDQTVYKEQLSTEYQPSVRTVMTPVTQYQWETQMAGRWNPFTQPYWTYRYVPRTTWETRNEEIHVPITRREIVPEQRTVQVPVTTSRIVQDEHVSRVAVGTSTAGSTVASREVGGIANLEKSDPPATGTSWRPFDGSARR